MKLYFIFYISLFTITVYSQEFGINTTTPETRFHIKESDNTNPNRFDGILLPRINNFPTVNPGNSQDGMLIYSMNDDKIYFWDSSLNSWKWLAHKSVSRFNELSDAKTDNDGTNNDSSIFLGQFSGAFDDETDNRNVGVGINALYKNTSGEFNVAVGYSALEENISGSGNIAIGYNSMKGNPTTNNNSYNTAIGHSSLSSVSTGSYNTAIGSEALTANSIGKNNVAIGMLSLGNNETGDFNTAMGYSSLLNNISGDNNTAMGYYALKENLGSFNTAIGDQSLELKTSGNYNTAFGTYSLQTIQTGNDNTAVGHNSGSTLAISVTSTYIGAFAGTIGGLTSVTNSTAVGGATYVSGDNKIRVGPGLTTDFGGYANWTNLSDGRFKKNVKEDVPGLSFITLLRPVTYLLNRTAINKYFTDFENKNNFEMHTFNKNMIQEVHTGFIAQEVEAVAASIGFDFPGIDFPKNKADHYGLRYADFVIPLIKAVQEQQVMIDSINGELKEIESIENKIDQLEKRIIQLENQQ